MTGAFHIKGVLLLLSLLHVCSAQQKHMASLYSKGALSTTTSSTLSWVSSRGGDQPPAGAVAVTVGGTEPWCRAKLHGLYAAGIVKSGVCNYPFLTTVHTTKEYDTLVSVNGSARLKYFQWDKFHNLPNNGVSTPQMILAVLKDENTGLYKPGFVDYQNREPYFINDGKVEKSTKATLIIEEEPIEYELFSIVLSEKDIERSFKEEIKTDIYLENTSTEEKLIESDEDFTEDRMQYWGGSVKGTIRGAKFSTPDKSDMVWGTYNPSKLKHTQKVSYMLPAGSAVKGTLVANMSTLDAGYTASLTAIFSDGYQMTRPIASRHTDERMAELRVDFEQPFNIADSTPIEALEESSTVLRHSTTTTTSTTTSTTTAPPGGKPPRSAQVGVSDASSLQGAVGTFALALLLLLSQ